MKCFGRCLRGLVAAIAVLMLGAGILLAFAASWLVRSDQPEKADAIVVLAGDARRARYAADLFHKGFAPRILVSRPVRTARERMLGDMGIVLPRSEEMDSMVMQRAGVPPERIDFFGEGSLSTFEEASVLGRMFAGQSPALLVVTSPYHTRRAGIILARHLPEAKMIMVATVYEEFPECWWTSQDAARDLLLEMAKLAYFALGGRFVAT
ncbi:MAG: YdcF family protein [Sterolibacteriaceae bacterium MAG5]|nr:YdcF family protein [Candidatus Nitricoxidireducens bremensis]